MSLHALADQIAAEHCDWARRQKLYPTDVIRGLGGSGWSRLPSWDEAHDYVARAWIYAHVMRFGWEIAA